MMSKLTLAAIAVAGLAMTAGCSPAASDDGLKPNTGNSGQAGESEIGNETAGGSGQAKSGSGGSSAKGGNGGGGGQKVTAKGGAAGSDDETGSGGDDEGEGGGSGRGGATGVGGKGSAGKTSGSGGKGTGGSTGAGGRGVGGGQNTGGGAGQGTAGGSGTSTSTCTTPEEETFSFFLVSQEALQRESGKTDGYGGNLGGLEGADAICQKVAEFVSKCQSSKVWHAFLSTSKVNAIDRVGTGPWYDRVGRLLANNKTELLQERPPKAAQEIKDDFPNEYGVPNHAPKNQQVDNHEILTGTGTDGKVYAQSSTGGGSGFPGMGGTATSCGTNEQWSVEKATCWDWTSSEPQGCPRVGHSWPRDMSGRNWMSCWNEGGCAPGGTLSDTGGLDGTRRVGSAGGYGGFYCFAVVPNPK